MSNNGDSPKPNPMTVDQMQQLLSEIQVTTFAADPSEVLPFGTTTISWQIVLPTQLHTAVTLSINDQKVQGLSGSAQFAFDSTDSPTPTFELVVHTSITSRTIASLTVTIYESDCAQSSLTPLEITSQLKTAIDSAIGATHLVGTGSVVTLGSNAISITIPINLNNQGTMTITVQLAVGMAAGGGKVSVTDSGINVQVDLSTSANVGSWCSDAMAQIAQLFMAHIVDAELAPQTACALDDQVTALVSATESKDQSGRQFVLTSFVVTPDGASYMVCPKVSAILPPPAQP
jgi:hypothetical protein